MFKLNDIVLIKSKNIVGTVVDVRPTDKGNEYTVENNTPGKRTDGYGGMWALFNCKEDEIVSVEKADKKTGKQAV